MGSALLSPTLQMGTLRPIHPVSSTRAGVGFKTKLSDSQIVLWPVYCFRILTFCLWSVVGSIFQKWPQHYFHPVFLDPCPNCPSKRGNLFPLPTNLARVGWLLGQTEMQKNQPTWLPWLGHKRPHRVWSRNPDAILWGNTGYTEPRVDVPANSQEHPSAPGFMGESEGLSPQLSRCPADANWSKLVLPC